MRTWTRATRWMPCGHCAKHLGVGEPIQVITLAGTTRELVRCEACAEGLAPPDLPDRVEPGRSTKRMTPLKAVADRVDWKARAGQAD